MEVETKNHVHIQNSPYKFDVTTYAPDKSSEGRGRFSVTVMQYITGSGWDSLNPMVKGNEVMTGFLNQVIMYELMGYKHVGLASKEIERVLENIWNE